MTLSERSCEPLLNHRPLFLSHQCFARFHGQRVCKYETRVECVDRHLSIVLLCISCIEPRLHIHFYVFQECCPFLKKFKWQIKIVMDTCQTFNCIFIKYSAKCVPLFFVYGFVGYWILWKISVKWWTKCSNEKHSFLTFEWCNFVWGMVPCGELCSSLALLSKLIHNKSRPFLFRLCVIWRLNFRFKVPCAHLWVYVV